MLDQSTLVDYIKRNLGFPFMNLEWSDEDIIEYTTKFSLKEWSYWVPDTAKMSLNTQLTANQVPGRGNEYYMNEPEGREILNIIDIYFDSGNLYALGHPPFGIFTEGELPDFALRVNSAMTTKMFSSWDNTFEFHHPNIVRISPLFPSEARIVTVEYERQQCEDLSEIPNDLYVLYEEFALADVMMALGRIRKRYGGGSLRTPFGEVPLESDIYEEGKELKREVKEKLERLFVPNIRIVHG